MGTDKRDRQRANKAMKQQQVARAETREKSSRIAVIVVGAIVAVFAIAFAANSFIGGDDANDDGATSSALPEDCPPSEGTETVTQNFVGPPPQCLDPDVVYSAVVTTNKGEITIDLDQTKAPETVNNFVFLARNRYFDDTNCHRIIPGFVVQCGDPTATDAAGTGGSGGPGYQIPDELPNEGEYRIGSIAMANSGPNTNGSQFFIITGEQGAGLPPQYSLFGDVVAGFDETVVVMEATGTADGSPTEPVIIESVEIIEG